MILPEPSLLIRSSSWRLRWALEGRDASGAQSIRLRLPFVLGVVSSPSDRARFICNVPPSSQGLRPPTGGREARRDACPAWTATT